MRPSTHGLVFASLFVERAQLGHHFVIVEQTDLSLNHLVRPALDLCAPSFFSLGLRCLQAPEQLVG